MLSGSSYVAKRCIQTWALARFFHTGTHPKNPIHTSNVVLDMILMLDFTQVHANPS